MEYKVLGDFINLVDLRNRELGITNLLGVSIEKRFIPSIANIVGTDLSSYKVVKNGQFAYGPVMHINHSTNKQGRTYRYFYDYGRKTMTGCSHDYATELKPDQVEDIVYKEMCKSIEQLVIAKHESTKPDPDSEAVRTEIIKVDEEINKLMGRLADAGDVLFSYYSTTSYYCQEDS